MLSMMGLQEIGVYGGFNGEAYAIDTPRMIISAERRA
jgi:hypothetical protein